MNTRANWRRFGCNRERSSDLPRLQIPLKGCYENLIEHQGELATVRLQPGTVLFAAANCWNLPIWRLNVELMSLLFGRKHLGISLVTGRGPVVPRLAVQKYSTPFPLSGPLPHILEALLELQKVKEPQAAYAELATALIRCVGELLRHPQVVNRSQSLLESMCVYLQNHYQHEVSRDSVAQQFNITPNHLSRLFQTHGSMTFSSYLTHVRIDRSKHLLSNYDLKLDDIAARCGFHDTPYFCRVFRQITKVSAAEYRAARRLQQDQKNIPDRRP